jgi:hypothetical protein
MIEQLMEMIISFYLFDIAVFTSIWLYIPLMIPFVFYLIFFVFKWMILTLPIWLPFSLIVNSFKRNENKN